MFAGAAIAALLAFVAAGRAGAQQEGLAPVGGSIDVGQYGDAVGEPFACSATDNDACVEEVVVTGARAAPASITNVQEAGVDEGDLVKLSGDILVILRRGRLFTVSTAGGRLTPVDRINAYPPGVDASDDWYDEMLVSEGRVVVIGYSYGRGGTEINRFRMDAQGRLAFEDSHHLQSNDYYSSRNYASRLIGSRLVLYSPQFLRRGADPAATAPRLSRWNGVGQAPAVTSLVSATDIQISPRYRDASNAYLVKALHTVTSCDLASAPLECRATAVLGPQGRTFYVSPNAVYLWLNEWRRRGEQADLEPNSSLYRIPLDGGRPTAIRARGAPVDQFSFSEDAAAGLLNVFLVSDAEGDAMWAPERAEGGAALLRLPLSRLGDGTQAAPDEDYRVLPPLLDGWSHNVNRFVGRHLAYASSSWSDDADESVAELNIAPLAGGPAVSFLVKGDVGRIEAMGDDVLAVASRENEDGEALGATFLTVSLDGPAPLLSDSLTIAASREAETRSHAFMFNPDSDSPDGSSGTIGLPIMRDVPDADDDDEALFRGAADMAYLRRDDGRLSQAGLLVSRPGLARDDGCVASCVDWYGDARPVFVGDRVFALLGYELVEGRLRNGRVREIRRVSFAPPQAPSRR